MMNWMMALTEAAVETVEAAPVANANSALVDLPLMTKGLLTTGMGLLGVFLVLTLFFVTIKMMQKIGVKKSSEE